MQRTEVDRVLARVERRLERGRWCRNNMLAPDGSRCLDGHIVRQSWWRPSRVRAVRRAVADYLRETQAQTGTWWAEFSDATIIRCWNDYRCADRQDALVLVRTVRALLLTDDLLRARYAEQPGVKV